MASQPFQTAHQPLNIIVGREVVTLDRIDTVAAGLAPPFAGKHTLRHVQEFVDDVVLVTYNPPTPGVLRTCKAATAADQCHLIKVALFGWCVQESFRIRVARFESERFGQLVFALFFAGMMS